METTYGDPVFATNGRHGLKTPSRNVLLIAGEVEELEKSQRQHGEKAKNFLVSPVKASWPCEWRLTLLAQPASCTCSANLVDPMGPSSSQRCVGFLSQLDVLRVSRNT